MFFGDADAGVLDGELDSGFCGFDVDGDATGFGVFDAVVEEVDDGLF